MRLVLKMYSHLYSIFFFFFVFGLEMKVRTAFPRSGSDLLIELGRVRGDDRELIDNL